MAIPLGLFEQGDVYIDFPFEDAMFRREFASGRVFRKFYGEAEVEVPCDSNLFHEAIRAGVAISRERYERG